MCCTLLTLWTTACQASLTMGFSRQEYWSGIFPTQELNLGLLYCRRLSAKELMLLNCGAEKTLESHLDCKEIKPVNPKGNQLWIFTGRTDAELRLQYFGHLMRKADSLEKTLMLGKTEGRRRRG